MKEFLAVSVAGATDARSDDAHVPSDRVVAYLPDATVHRTPDGWIAAARPDPDDRFDDPALGFTVRLTRAVRGRGGDVSTAALAALLGIAADPAASGPHGSGGESQGGAALAGLLPPFAAADRARPGAPVVVAGDWLGLRQLFWWQGDGVAAISTSALALAALARTGLDVPALGVQSLLGWQVGVATVFRDITKLAPGHLAVLDRGRITPRPYLDEPMDIDVAGLSTMDIIDEMAQLLQDFHGAYLTDHPDTVLQLSAGQDSRLLLCSVPSKLRKGLRAVTLDTHGGQESVIAARLSDVCGLDHQVHWLDEQTPIDPPTAYRMALDAARDLDCMGSPLALAPLTLAESALEQGHRISGAGGETARGFYYPGQPRAATTSPAHVRRLAAWRLYTNEAVASDALEPDFAAAARDAGFEAVHTCFSGYSTNWLRATDEFYLFQRVQRWAGAHCTHAAVQRLSVNPYMDRRWLQLALAPAPAEKRNSYLMGRLILRLDPELAAVPFDSGLVPARLAQRGMLTSASVVRVYARKAVRKVRQRFGGVRRPQLGAAEMANLVAVHWRTAPELVAPLRDLGVVRGEWLDELLAGRRPAEPATVAFLMNLLVAATAGRTPG